jgi:hypothetical protein
MRTSVFVMSLIGALTVGGTVAQPLLAESVAPEPVPLNRELGGLRWGASSAEVLRSVREELFEAYRVSIAGVNDPVAVDRLRREVDDTFRRLEQSVERFDAPRTGYEVSALAGEVVGGVGQSLLTVRSAGGAAGRTRYFVFANDRLVKLIIPSSIASLDFMSFENFEASLAEQLGRPTDRETVLDELGIRQLVRAKWTDGVTTARIENRKAAVDSYVVVYADATFVEPVAAPGVASPAAPATRVGDMIRGLRPRGAGDGSGQ